MPAPAVVEHGEYGWQKETVAKALPRNGNGTVLKECEGDPDLWAPRGEQIIAVLDLDKAPRLLGLPGGATVGDCEAAFAKHLPSGKHAQFSVVFLKDNMESVLRFASQCDPTISAKTLEAALEKNLTKRDELLLQAVQGDRAVRDCIQAQMRSFKALVDLVLKLVQGQKVPGLAATAPQKSGKGDS